MSYYDRPLEHRELRAALIPQVEAVGEIDRADVSRG
jgi:hypothetical protein